VQVLKGKVEVRVKQRGPFQDTADDGQQQASSAPGSSISKADKQGGSCGISRAGSAASEITNRKRRSGSISSDDGDAAGQQDSKVGQESEQQQNEEGTQEEEDEEEEVKGEEEEETIAGIPLVQLRTLFDSIDEDGSGEIDAEELHGALRKMGMRKSPAEVQELLLMADPDGSGAAAVLLCGLVPAV
jgi:hypothetical protein